MKGDAPSTLPSWMPTPSRLTGLVWSAAIALRAGGLPDIGLFFNGGLGDDIMCSAVARELRKRGTRKIWQLTSFPEIFAGNADVIAVPADFRLRRLCGLFGVPCLELEYPHPPPQHLIATLCAAAGVRGEVELRPYIVVTEAERRAGKVVPRTQVAIQSSSLSARFPMRNKQWPHERFQAVVEALKDRFDFVQLGSTSDPALAGAADFRGRTTVRETAGILAASQLFVGLVSGVMHLARGVDCRSVIIYGGREHPSQSGYTANINLYWDGSCSPCWQRDACDYDRRCLQDITPDAVIAAMQRQLEKNAAPLAIDRTELRG